jgi:hypothetical protein
MPSRRALAPLALVALNVLVAAPASAQTKESMKLQCVQASDKAQQLRVAGKLVAARDALRTCVQDACPSVVREACSQWLGEVNASLPSIVIGAKDSDGRDLLDLKVSIDGTLVTEHLGGRALPIDPGRHKMRYEKADGAVVEEEILVGEGTKNREVSVVFPGPLKPAVVVAPIAPEAPAAGSSSKGPSTTNTVVGIVFAGIGAAALGTALALDVTTTSDVDSLRSSPCAKTATCSQSTVNSDQLKYDMAGVGLGVGIAAVGAAVYVLIAHPFGTPTSTRSASAPLVLPTPGGVAVRF